MKTAQRYRKLRIAWSVVWGVTAMLLIALWVRSHYYAERITAVQSDGWETSVYSGFGELILQRTPAQLGSPPTSWKYSAKVQTQSQSEWESRYYPAESGFKLPDYFGWYSAATLTRLDVQHSCVVIGCTVIAILPWLPVRRFSLRTLLITTTLVAVVLGLIVWLR